MPATNKPKRVKKGTGYLSDSGCVNLRRHGNSSSSPPWGDVASQKGRAAHGAGHGHPEAGGKKFLHQGVGLHPVSTAHPAAEEVKSRTKEIRQLASNRCPVPFSSHVVGEPCGAMHVQLTLALSGRRNDDCKRGERDAGPLERAVRTSVHVAAGGNYRH